MGINDDAYALFTRGARQRIVDWVPPGPFDYLRARLLIGVLLKFLSCYLRMGRAKQLKPYTTAREGSCDSLRVACPRSTRTRAPQPPSPDPALRLLALGLDLTITTPTSARSCLCDTDHG